MWVHFNYKKGLKRHIESKYEGMRYPCDKFEYSAISKGYLKIHIDSKEKGVSYL